jgi:hypothetical protein
MNISIRLKGLLFIALLTTACSSTTISDSWSRPSYKSQIKNVYIIGIDKSELNRMIFEDTFSSRLSNEGIKAHSSYMDLPDLLKKQETSRQAIIQKMKANECDSVLLTRQVGKRTDRSMPSYYGNWGTYYSYSTYQTPASITILTVESVLYDLKTEELIWSARMETNLEENTEEMIQTFADEVIKDLKKKGLI